MLASAAMKKRKPGRPTKPDAAKFSPARQLRLDPEVDAAVEAFAKREGCATTSEALRRLLRAGCRAEGLL